MLGPVKDIGCVMTKTSWFSAGCLKQPEALAEEKSSIQCLKGIQMNRPQNCPKCQFSGRFKVTWTETWISAASLCSRRVGRGDFWRVRGPGESLRVLGLLVSPTLNEQIPEMLEMSWHLDVLFAFPEISLTFIHKVHIYIIFLYVLLYKNLVYLTIYS